MKKMLISALVVLSCISVFCLYAAGQTGKWETSSQDLLIKSEVETAVSMLQAIYAKHTRGEMTLDQAKKLGADLLRQLRYGTDGYFWADTIYPVRDYSLFTILT
jgi:methyl-accepting chemotaxis protein